MSSFSTFFSKTKTNTVQLPDGTTAYCLRPLEASILDQHISGYLQHGIHLTPDAVVFDVGANIGLMGIRVLQQFPNAQVFAFEPIPAIFEVLRQNAQPFNKTDKKHFIALPFGIAAERGSTVFNYYPNAPASSTAYPEMWSKESWQEAVNGNLRHAAPSSLQWVKWLPAAVHQLTAKWLHANAQTVHCELRTLSDMMAQYEVTHIDLLKIDCEGNELSVLLGIETVDWPKIQQVVVEVHDVDNRLETVRQLLQKHGFTNIVTDQELALQKTNLVNVYAMRT